MRLSRVPRARIAQFSSPATLLAARATDQHRKRIKNKCRCEPAIIFDLCTRRRSSSTQYTLHFMDMRGHGQAWLRTCRAMDIPCRVLFYPARTSPALSVNSVRTLLSNDCHETITGCDSRSLVWPACLDTRRDPLSRQLHGHVLFVCWKCAHRTMLACVHRRFVRAFTYKCYRPRRSRTLERLRQLRRTALDAATIAGRGHFRTRCHWPCSNRRPVKPKPDATLLSCRVYRCRVSSELTATFQLLLFILYVTRRAARGAGKAILFWQLPLRQSCGAGHRPAIDESRARLSRVPLASLSLSHVPLPLSLSLASLSHASILVARFRLSAALACVFIGSQSQSERGNRKLGLSSHRRRRHADSNAVAGRYNRLLLSTLRLHSGSLQKMAAQLQLTTLSVFSRRSTR